MSILIGIIVFVKTVKEKKINLNNQSSVNYEDKYDEYENNRPKDQPPLY